MRQAGSKRTKTTRRSRTPPGHCSRGVCPPPGMPHGSHYRPAAAPEPAGLGGLPGWASRPTERGVGGPSPPAREPTRRTRPLKAVVGLPAGIQRHGLLCWKSLGRLKAVWLASKEKSSWAAMHVAWRHGSRIEAVVTLEVDVPRSLAPAEPEWLVVLNAGHSAGPHPAVVRLRRAGTDSRLTGATPRDREEVLL